MNDPTRSLALTVRNEPGVLARAAGLLSRSGLDIESLSAGQTDDPAVFRMTLVVRGDAANLEQAAGQLAGLAEALEVSDLSQGSCLDLEMTLIKVRAEPGQHGRIMEIVSRFYAEIIDAGRRTMIIAAAGDADRTESLIQALRPLGLIELARSGRVAMARCTSEENEASGRFARPALAWASGPLPGRGPAGQNHNLNQTGGHS